jgi:hypothetical protein
MVNGQNLSYGDNLRDFGMIGVESNDYLTGIITGTLEYGTEIDNEFRIVVTPDGSDIFIVPEPATLSLFLLGSAFLFKKKNI